MKYATLWVTAAVTSMLCFPALAKGTYSPGASDTEIRIGQTLPYSGPLSGYSVMGKVETAYYAMLNEHGGINGRKITLLSLDDGYSPPKTVEQTRKLVEDENVLAIAGTIGTPTNSAIQKYLNGRQVPQLFAGSGAAKWADPEHFPWTIAFNPSNQIEGRIYAKWLLQNKPAGKIAVLYQNDDYGKDYLRGFKDGLGAKAAGMIVKEVTYEATDPVVDSQIITLQDSGADVFFDVTTPKAAAQAIRKTYDIGWKAVHLINNPGTSVSATLTPAGLDKSVGLISAQYAKDATDPQWRDDQGFKEWLAFMKKYVPDVDINDSSAVYAYNVATVVAQTLRQCGDNLTRENVMKQVGNLNLTSPMLLPGVRMQTSPTDYFMIKQMQLARFNGKTWELFGGILSAT